LRPGGRVASPAGGPRRRGGVLRSWRAGHRRRGGRAPGRGRV